MSKLGHILRESKIVKFVKRSLDRILVEGATISKSLQKSLLKYDKAAIAFLQTNTMNPHENIISMRREISLIFFFFPLLLPDIQ